MTSIIQIYYFAKVKPSQTMNITFNGSHNTYTHVPSLYMERICNYCQSFEINDTRHVCLLYCIIVFVCITKITNNMCPNMTPKKCIFIWAHIETQLLLLYLLLSFFGLKHTNSHNARIVSLIIQPSARCVDGTSKMLRQNCKK